MASEATLRRRRRRLIDPHYDRDQNLRQRYRITHRQWVALLRSQRNRCAVCSRRYEGNPRAWATDHDHATGQVRGILCNPCNTSLKRHLTPALLRRMAEYLERGGSRPASSARRGQSTRTRPKAGFG